jgi:hypothetical protein
MKTPTPGEQEIEDTPTRTWPDREAGEPLAHEWDTDRLTREETNGWEM